MVLFFSTSKVAKFCAVLQTETNDFLLKVKKVRCEISTNKNLALTIIRDQSSEYTNLLVFAYLQD